MRIRVIAVALSAAALALAGESFAQLNLGASIGGAASTSTQGSATSR